MLLAETINSMHSTWRVGFIFRITRLISAENCLSFSRSAASGHIRPGASTFFDDVADVDA